MPPAEGQVRLHRLLSLCAAGSAAAVLVVVNPGCSSDFDSTRKAPERGTLGRELFSLVCDRVGAQALREDVTGASFHDVCHRAPDGSYTNKVDRSRLIAIDPHAVDAEGKAVSIDAQTSHRAYRIARIEALAARREEIVEALDAALPSDVQHELASVLGRVVDLYNDETIPRVTRALGRFAKRVESDPEAQNALTRISGREGYRPLPIALGAVRPILAYPRIVELVDSFLALISAAPPGASATVGEADARNDERITGRANRQFQALLEVSRAEFQAAELSPSIGALASRRDPHINREILSRPRTALELAREILLAETSPSPRLPPIPRLPSAPSYIVRRDARGLASVALAAGQVPAPFVDSSGSGVPDINAAGGFIFEAGNDAAPSPFFSPRLPDGTRDTFGRAISASDAPLYNYVDVNRTYFSQFARDVAPLIASAPQAQDGSIVDALAGLLVLAGPRDPQSTTQKVYAHRSVKYRAFHPDNSPMIDLLYAASAMVTDPVADDALALVSKLMQDDPNAVARLVALTTRLASLAELHPEAHLASGSTFWDDMMAVAVEIVQEPGVIEDLLRALAERPTQKLGDVLPNYFRFKDELTYDRDNLNGVAFNLTTNSLSPMSTPVDRSRPDTDENRSAMQRFLQLLHDANGLAACNKDGAVAHIRWKFRGLDLPLLNLIPLNIPVNFDYPNDPTWGRIPSDAVCALVGESPPRRISECGVIGFENVDALIVDIVVGNPRFEIRDRCLSKLLASPYAQWIGGGDNFLQDISGIRGFSTHPNVNGISRLVYFDTPFPGLPRDTTRANSKTSNFILDVMDPVPSMVCDPAPITTADGKTFNLRRCANVKDTLRVRDRNALFPVEQNGFVEAVRPLASAFAKHNKALFFVDLFDAAHLHWGSASQSRDECDPASPHGSPGARRDASQDARWCAQSGVVTYEPLLADMMSGDLFPELGRLVQKLSSVKISHCTGVDARTHECRGVVEYDGVRVVAELARAMLDPSRRPGLVDRHGRSYAIRNDGAHAPLTPMYMLADAFSGIDAAFEKDRATNADGVDHGSLWKGARSRLFNQFLAVDGAGDSAEFKNKEFIAALTSALPLLRAQLAANCSQYSITGECSWRVDSLSAKISDVVRGPLFSAMVDLSDAVRKDARATEELQKLFIYLVDPQSGNDARQATLGSLVDILQWLDDDKNITPLMRLASEAIAPSHVDGALEASEEGVVNAGINALTRMLAHSYDSGGRRNIAAERDPTGALPAVIRNLVTPMPKGLNRGDTPIDVLMSAMGDVNRKIPGDTASYAAFDFANIADELGQFLLDPAHGLEQMYEVIRQATARHP